MNRYAKLYRFLKEDMDNIDTVLRDSEQRTGTPQKYVVDRSDSADASPLEIDFEDNFAEVYGMDGLKYLSREYGIIDNQGNNYFLDYFLHTKHGNKAVEENGREYHHPQAIGLDAVLLYEQNILFIRSRCFKFRKMALTDICI